jgi:ribosomal protein S21
MAVNIEVKKGGNENASSLIRRFTKRVQGSGILRRVRSIRYYARPKSEFVTKKQRLKSLDRKKQYDELVKLGKVAERQVHTPRK